MAKRSKKRVTHPGAELRRLCVRDLGPIRAADVEFGHLTTLVGHQASGKSLFLQALALAIDAPAVHRRLEQSDAIRSKEPEEFLQLVFGEGMQGAWTGRTRVSVDGIALTPKILARGGDARDRALFFVPAQRTTCLRDGFTRPFGEYKAGDPFFLRSFSQDLHDLVQSEFLGSGRVFPKRGRLPAPLPKRIADTIYGRFDLRIEQHGLGRRFVLQTNSAGETGAPAPLPFLVWSAGQREFTPLLLGTYCLLPVGSDERRAALRWVVIEEPETGLHPDAIQVVMDLVLELLFRGYRVVLSTHSAVVLDLQWVLGRLQELHARAEDVLELFGLPKDPRTKRLADRAMELELRAYFFARNGSVKDISTLDPGSPDHDVSGWGGVIGSGSDTGAILARAVNRAEGIGR